MRIGIIETGRVPPELQPEFGSYADMFETWLGRASAELSFVRYDAMTEALPPAVDACDAYLLTGSGSGAYDPEPWIPPLERFIRTAYDSGQALIGVCFGHQIMAQALGGRVEKSPRGWGIGTAASKIVHVAPWMDPPREMLRLLVTHQDQVVELPPGARVLAGNEHCPFGLVQYAQHAISVQGHPEHRKEYTKALIWRRSHIHGPEAIAAALETMTLPTDEDVLGRWIIRFLRKM